MIEHFGRHRGGVAAGVEEREERPEGRHVGDLRALAEGMSRTITATLEILPLEFLLGDDPVHGSLSGWIVEWLALLFSLIQRRQELSHHK